MATDTDPLPCIGVVLAGGQSRRMGCDKALLRWHGRPLIEHQLALLRATGVDDVMVSGTRPEYAGIADTLAQAGPLAGLAAVAGTLPGDAQLLVIPVDMPLLTPALLARLRTQQPHARCLQFAGRVLPLRLRIDTPGRALLDRLVHVDGPRERSLRALQHAIGTQAIDLRDAEAVQLTDCNTQATWDEVSA